jgi:hypothetical protein
VLRIVGTVNTKSNEVVRVIHVTRGRDGEPVRYGFEQLAVYRLGLSGHGFATQAAFFMA